ncbi:VOC family protein [Parasphingopyxis marina]|uniref:VOC family protein n=1 Tax=Parasphingopyxis marina TaxID=2761622 RepID=A0A842I2J5_9SPHN|nr:VOC family protein [Parasphingopyxis marina]MBC2778973.1 VOC family protein [Parasphingopyxis marina]
MTLEPAGGAIDIGIVTVNEAAMRSFYEELLGLPVVGEVPTGADRIVKLQCGSSAIKLYVLAAQPEAGSGAGHYLAATGIRYFTIPVRNLRATVETCREAGVSVVTDVVEPRPGLIAALIADPDGNTIELMETQ